jgi:hypothetical protein
VPPKNWTAWPLQPEDVPREGEHVGPEDPDEVYTFKRRERQRPSRELEEILMGVTLKYAKERFEAREWADNEEDEDVDGVEDGEDGEEMRTKIRTENVGEPSSGDLEDQSRAQDEDELQDINESELLQHGGVVSEEDATSTVIKEQSEPPSRRTFLRPVVSADDQRSRELLRPSIRHTLSQLDEVLMALHHARNTCRQYASQSEAISDNETRASSTVDDPTTSVKRPRGRPRKFANLPERPKLDGESQDKKLDDAELWRSKKTHRGRPKKKYERLEGETQQDYLVRIARIQKKPLPSFAPPLEVETPESSPPPKRKYTRRSPSKRATPEEKRIARERKLGLRDWSEVVGSAALVGFPSDIIARATQRCATLFGEGMSMRAIDETPFSTKDADHVINYQPEEIPAFDTEVTETEGISDEESDASDSVKPKRTTSVSKKPKGILPRQQTCFCPILGCPRETQGFSHISRLRRHLKKGHKMKKEEVDEFFLPSDDEMNGAVHVDGFLRPVKNKGRGKDVKERKKGRWEESEGDDASSDKSESASEESIESSSSDSS